MTFSNTQCLLVLFPVAATPSSPIALYLSFIFITHSAGTEWALSYNVNPWNNTYTRLLYLGQRCRAAPDIVADLVTAAACIIPPV
ncbi:hypothetical protein PF010_g10479 [Phytophthora fragariae]|uniref:Uncharacterized protein n=1 Tax=Phytophthora fragariae TaxID=53985 RepID=A0A6G0L8S9_9STRA|nr:hypothetical protein PF010_g10479 [Phytophthora fragariae]